MLKIITVYKKNLTQKDKALGIFSPVDMSNGRWIKISEALGRLGHQVDIAVPDSYNYPVTNGNGSHRTIPLSKVKWEDYDIVKTEFHSGYNSLELHGGASHPFIISKLGSVVAPYEMEGIYFYGDVRKSLFELQEKINTKSRYITVLSQSAKELWKTVHGREEDILIVPGAADSVIPEPSSDPFPDDKKNKIIFAGNVYDQNSQPEANKVIIGKLNKLGELLSKFNSKLYFVGPGDISKLNTDYVTNLGIVSHDECWNLFQHADVGIVVSAGKFMHNNESTKIYHYLRAGLPVVSEAGFPNDYVIEESKLGYVSENDNMKLMAENIIEAAQKKWDKEYGINYILENHTWDKRVEVYDKLFKENFSYTERT